ncbi:molybdopterin-dependent oxidoreductase [Actinomadura sp. B10D3]|uniref:molybdopterin-dependent oxidoreductase n=1 Tax=Actinomadura sp. B10D3 TaxID=3153557 RepID=UPI00325C3F8D
MDRATTQPGVVMAPADRTVIRDADAAALASYLTPVTDHYVLGALGIAHCDAERWTLTVTGSVDRPLTLSMDEVRALPSVELTVTLECAGDPLNPDKPVRRVSTAAWRGVPLADLLRLARPHPDASDVWFDGADHGTYRPNTAVAEAVAEYRKDLPLATASGGDVLVAYAMNGEPLPTEHGSPLRLIVPGHYGTNSVKWLKRITVANGRPQGLFCSVLYQSAEQVDGRIVRRPVRQVAVNSLITDPAPGATLTPGRVRVTGWAWGAREVAAVEVMAEPRGVWQPARLEPRTDHAWQRFDAALEIPAAGEYRLAVRARDRGGAVQPAEEHINQIPHVTVHVGRG